MTLRSSADTAARLLAVATRQFAARGFYGVSIAAIADELGITKQALLHHFGTKEKLYSAVLSGISERFLEALGDTGDVVEVFDRFYRYSREAKDDMAIILRELLDNEHRAATARQWFLRPFLERLVGMAQTARPEMTRAEALASVYVFIGAVNYYAVSGPTLMSIFGTEHAEQTAERMPDALRDMVTARFG